MRAAVVALVPFLCSAIPTAPKIFQRDKSEALSDAEIALCFTGIWQGLFNLVRGSLGMYEASIDCRDGRLTNRVAGPLRRLEGEGGFALEREAALAKIRGRIAERSSRREECAASVTEVIGAFSESASFFSAAASDCIVGISDMAYCAADITAVFGALGQVSNVASTVNMTCNGINTMDDGGLRRLQESPLPASAPSAVRPRRGLSTRSPEGLSSASSAAADADGAAGIVLNVSALEEIVEQTRKKIEKRDRRIEVTECVLDINQGLGALMRAGLAINQATKRCTPDQLTTDDGRRICAVDVSGTIGSFTFAAEYLSFAASHCPKHFIGDAECAGSIFELATALASFSAAGAALPITCNPNMKDFDEGVPPDRRLTVDTSNHSAVFV